MNGRQIPFQKSIAGWFIQSIISRFIVHSSYHDYFIPIDWIPARHEIIAIQWNPIEIRPNRVQERTKQGGISVVSLCLYRINKHRTETMTKDRHPSWFSQYTVQHGPLLYAAAPTKETSASTRITIIHLKCITCTVLYCIITEHHTRLVRACLLCSQKQDVPLGRTRRCFLLAKVFHRSLRRQVWS